MTYALRAVPTRPPRSIAIECHAHADLGRVWLILFDPDEHAYFVERDGERVASDLYSLDSARTAVRADVRAYQEE